MEGRDVRFEPGLFESHPGNAQRLGYPFRHVGLRLLRIRHYQDVIEGNSEIFDQMYDLAFDGLGLSRSGTRVYEHGVLV